MRTGYYQWLGLAGVVLASAVTIALLEHRRWPLGFDGGLSVALRETLGGAAFAVALIGGADAMILALGGAAHAIGKGFPGGELLTVFLPAAVHEELLFRGYPYQKLRRRFPRAAMIAMSLLFAALHLGNRSVTWLALTNIFLGGVILALAFERFQRLWLPIGLHLVWNLMSGPILGYEVSGYRPEQTLLTTSVAPLPLITGGSFGIEGSVMMTVGEALAVGVLLAWGRTRIQTQNAE